MEQLKSINPVASNQLTTIYLNSLYRLKVANFNKTEYDNAYKEVKENSKGSPIAEDWLKASGRNPLLVIYPVQLIKDNNSDNDNVKVINELDIESIYNYYKDSEKVNPHMVLPNYLKLPQVLEKNV